MVALVGIVNKTNMENNSNSIIRKDSIFLILCVCFLVLFVILAAVSGSWPGKDISAQFFSAIAGALIAAIITLFLLKGQTAVEVDRQKDSKVFEEKLGIYQDFLHKLCDVVKDQKITPEEEIMLQFQVSYIAMHTKTSSIKVISDNIKEIVLGLKKDKPDANDMLGRLFNIADEFHKELYDNDNSVLVGPDREDTIENFRSILIGKEDVQEYEDNEKQKIIDRYNKKIESRMELTIPERLKYLKAKIDSNGADSCNLFYGGKLLNYEFYNKTNKEGKFVKTPDRIAVDLLPDEDVFVIRVGTRRNDPEKTKRIIDSINGRFTPGDTELTAPHWHVHAKFAQGTPDDEIIKNINDLLMRINYYRNGKLSSK